MLESRRYSNAALTVIAACLVWMVIFSEGPPRAEAEESTQDVRIVGVGGRALSGASAHAPVGIESPTLASRVRVMQK